MASELQEDREALVGDIPPITLDKDREGRTSLPESLALVLTNTLRALISKLNGGLSLGNGLSGYKAGNFDASQQIVVTPGTANTEFVVLHRLGRKPAGYVVSRSDKAVRVYDSSVGSWTDRLMYLKADVATATVTLVVW